MIIDKIPNTEIIKPKIWNLFVFSIFSKKHKKIIKDYNLSNSSKILDLGCGKAFLLHEIKQILPDIYLIGIDISNHGINNTTPEMKSHLNLYDARKPLPYQEKEFD